MVDAQKSPSTHRHTWHKQASKHDLFSAWPLIELIKLLQQSDAIAHSAIYVWTANANEINMPNK